MSEMENRWQADEGFDPLAAMQFDSFDDVGYEGYVPPIEEPDPANEPAAKPELPPRERIEALIKGMPGQKKLVLHVIDFCRDEKKLSDVVEEIRLFENGMVNVYSPETICANLERAGALRVVEQGCCDDAAMDDRGVEADAEESEFIAITPQLDFSYVATPEGIEVVDEDDPSARLAALIADDVRYFPVYDIVLRECLPAEGLGKKAIDALIDNHPLCKKPRRYSGHFLKKLEAVDAISFDGTWHTTEVGKQLMNSPEFAATN